MIKGSYQQAVEMIHKQGCIANNDDHIYIGDVLAAYDASDNTTDILRYTTLCRLWQPFGFNTSLWAISQSRKQAADKLIETIIYTLSYPRL